MRSGPTVKALAGVTDPLRALVHGLVRRVIVTAHAAADRWQLQGVRGIDGDEVITAEVFPGVGFAARPASTGKPEAIAVNVGGAKAPAVVATRDEKTAAAVRAAMGALGAGDTLVYNAAVIVYLRANGTVEIRTPAGTAASLATKADVEALRTYVVNQFSAASGHIHSTPSGPTVTITTVAAPGTAPTVVPSAVTGTTVLKGQ